MEDEDEDDDPGGQVRFVTTVLLVLLLKFGSVFDVLIIAVLNTLIGAQGVTVGVVKDNTMFCVPGTIVPMEQRTWLPSNEQRPSDAEAL